MVDRSAGRELGGNEGIMDIKIAGGDIRDHRGTLEPTNNGINQIEMFNNNTPGNNNTSKKSEGLETADHARHKNNKSVLLN